MPEEGINLLRHQDILSFEEVYEVVKTGVKMGIEKVRITGGEPLVRKGIVNLVSMLARIDGIRDLSMTTNGILLVSFANSLVDAGLSRVNISLDTLDPEKYRDITHGGNLQHVLRGIKAAKNAGLNPIKLNCVVRDSSNEKDAMEVRKFGMRNGLQVRFIRQMNLEKGDFSVVEGGDGGNCHKCNRLRLTANGMIKPCLFSNVEFSVREFGAEKAIKMALSNKPLEGTQNLSGMFYNIGG
jgi:cyclic pyranopterin phosphate synthase